jgi:hypothetical protein
MYVNDCLSPYTAAILDLFHVRSVRFAHISFISWHNASKEHVGKDNSIVEIVATESVGFEDVYRELCTT